MNTLFFILTILFIIVSVSLVLIILMQRAQGGGLAGAFGGAGGSGTDTVFGGRVGDALTWATVIAFALYLLCAIALNRVQATPTPKATPAAQVGGQQPGPPTTPEGGAGIPAEEEEPAPVPIPVTPVNPPPAGAPAGTPGGE